MRSKGKRHSFETGGKRGRAGIKATHRRRARHLSREEEAKVLMEVDRERARKAEDRLSIEDEAHLFATGHLPEDF